MKFEGGLAEFSIIPLDAQRSIVRIGDKRLFDLIHEEDGLVAEYKPAKRDAIHANPMELISQLMQKMDAQRLIGG